jgi:hypothetical protein
LQLGQCHAEGVVERVCEWTRQAAWALIAQLHDALAVNDCSHRIWRKAYYGPRLILTEGTLQRIQPDPHTREVANRDSDRLPAVGSGCERLGSSQLFRSKRSCDVSTNSIAFRRFSRAGHKRLMELAE